MFEVHVMYPNEPGAEFDHDYYRTEHMALVERHMKPFGLVRTAVLKGVSGGAGTPPPYLCVGVLVFESADGYDQAVQAIGTALREDISNFTNTTPTRVICEQVS